MSEGPYANSAAGGADHRHRQESARIARGFARDTASFGPGARGGKQRKCSTTWPIRIVSDRPGAGEFVLATDLGARGAKENCRREATLRSSEYVVNNAGFGLMGQSGWMSSTTSKLDHHRSNVRVLAEFVACVNSLTVSSPPAAYSKVASVASFLRGPGMAGFLLTGPRR